MGPWSAASSAAKHTNETINENTNETISGSAITSSWVDEDHTENIIASTASWVVQASELRSTTVRVRSNTSTRTTPRIPAARLSRPPGSYRLRSTARWRSPL